MNRAAINGSRVSGHFSPLVYDVGFNIGQDSAHYLSQGCRVVAVEADPTLVAKGCQRFADEIASGQLTLVNAGIAAEEGEADFWVCDDKPEFNSFIREIAARDGHPHHRTTVRTLRFKSILARYGIPHFLKIDIEGHDLLCLEDLDARRLPAYLSIESECPIDAEASNTEAGLLVLHRLRALGYRDFKLIDQRNFQSLSVPASFNQRLQSFCERFLLRPPLHNIRGTYRLSQHLMPKTRLERKFGRHFPLGSSGAWGEDTAGRWLTFAEAETALIHYRDLHFRDPLVKFHTFWCDLHARARRPAE